MRRRTLLAAPAILTGCSVLPSRPYLEKREWPLDPRRPSALGPKAGGPVLLVRGLRAAPGLEARGLQVLQADGSVRTDFYEEWSVPPADAVEDALRRWLAAAGLFAAVLAPGSRARADLALEGELLTLLAVPASRVSRASLGIVLLDLRPAPVRVLLQAEVTAEAQTSGAAASETARSGRDAVAGLFADMERRIADALPRR